MSIHTSSLKLPHTAFSREKWYMCVWVGVIRNATPPPNLMAKLVYKEVLLTEKCSLVKSYGGYGEGWKYLSWLALPKGALG